MQKINPIARFMMARDRRRVMLIRRSIIKRKKGNKNMIYMTLDVETTLRRKLMVDILPITSAISSLALAISTWIVLPLTYL